MQDGGMTTAASLINQLGRQVVADACGVDVSRVYRWTYPTEKGGTGGRIPAKHFQAVLALAKKNGVEVDPWILVQPHEKRAS